MLWGEHRLAMSRRREIRDRTIGRLASLLANGVKVRPGQSYPNGWDFMSGQRLYEVATEPMLRSAVRLIRGAPRKRA